MILEQQKCTIIEQKIPNNILRKSVKLFGQCYFYVYRFKHVKSPYCYLWLSLKLFVINCPESYYWNEAFSPREGEVSLG